MYSTTYPSSNSLDFSNRGNMLQNMYFLKSFDHKTNKTSTATSAQTHWFKIRFFYGNMSTFNIFSK